MPGNPNRKLVLVADTHDRYGMFPMPEGDILLHAGDFTFRGRPDELSRFNDWLDAQGSFAHKVIIPGNHDLSFEVDWCGAVGKVPAADAVLNGQLYEALGLKIWGEPRQPEFYNWAFNVSREGMKKVWEKVPPDIDILLTHGPPYGVGDMTLPRNFKLGEHVGCKYQRQWIEENQPRLVVCGHIHPGYGIYMLGNTLVVNASVCTEAYKPTNPPIVLHI